MSIQAALQKNLGRTTVALRAPLVAYNLSSLLSQVDTEIFDVLVKDTGRTKQELHDWAKTENELKEICTPEEIAG